MNMKHIIGAGILASTAQLASAGALPGPLVTAQWLHDHLGEVTVVDIRDDVKTFAAEPKFVTDKSGAKKLAEVAGHVPGALSVDFGSIRSTRKVGDVAIKAQMPTADDFAKTMDAAGLAKGDKPIVIVSPGDSVDAMDMATRLYFQLRYFGQPAGSVAVVNGGVAAWLQAGYDVSSDKSSAPAGDWAAGKTDDALLATLDEVKKQAHAGNVQFIDARPTAQYLGYVTKPVVKSAGHLPGAKSLPTDAIVHPVGAASEFLTAAGYHKVFADYGIEPAVATVTYCNTGHLASGAWFVSHELLGNKNSKLYAGSMIEWTNLGNPTVSDAQ